MTRGKEFENAVYDFAKAISPESEILFDHKRIDRDTGEYRQCDVWINGNMSGFWPVSILVSCKDHRRKIDIGHIGEFCNEVRSTGAHFGIIFSSSGFTESAKRKAQSNGLICCQLFRNESTNLPRSLHLPSVLYRAKIEIRYSEIPRDWKDVTWGDLLSIPDSDSRKSTFLDTLTNDFFCRETNARDEYFNKRISPLDWTDTYRISFPDSEVFSIVVHVSGKWEMFVSTSEATLVNGVYCFDNSQFFGTQYGPVIDLHGRNPGKDWKPVSTSKELPSSPQLTAFMYGARIRETILQSLWNRKIGEDQPQKTVEQDSAALL